MQKQKLTWLLRLLTVAKFDTVFFCQEDVIAIFVQVLQVRFLYIWFLFSQLE